MMRFKKVFYLAAAFCVAASGVTGCGGNKSDAVLHEDLKTAMETPYEINWYINNTTQDDVASVENEINAYIKDKINATVKLNILETSQYSQQMSSMIQAGEYFDMCFAASWMLNYNENAENGAFVAFDDYFKDYLPKTYELSDKESLECARIDGKIYALPVIKENAENYGWIYRKDIADKYGIDMSSIKSFEELEPYLKKIKENEPDIEYPIDWDTDASPSGGILDVSVITAKVLGLKDGNSTDVINILETDAFVDGCRTAHRFYKEGLIKEDILTSSGELNTRMKSGKTFCHMNKLKPGKAQELYKNSAYEFEQVDVTPARKPITYGLGSMTAVSATSKNPARVMRFIELLNTDEYLNNLVIYGIEGKHYDKVGEKVVKVKPGTKYTLAGSQWAIANVFLTYPTNLENPDKNKILKEYDTNALDSKLVGFNFVTEKVQPELAACANVDKQYRNQLMLGVSDPDAILPEYLEQLRGSGIDKIKEELQKQILDFASKKK